MESSRDEDETIAELVLWKRFNPEETGDQLSAADYGPDSGIGSILFFGVETQYGEADGGDHTE
jgi:hypothetical protein